MQKTKEKPIVSLRKIDLQTSKVYEEVLQKKKVSYYQDSDGSFQLADETKVRDKYIAKSESVETIDGVVLTKK